MTRIFALTLAVSAAAATSASAFGLNLLSQFDADDAEIVSFDSSTDRLFTTNNDGVLWTDVSDLAAPGAQSLFDYTGVFGDSSLLDGFSSVAIAPNGSGLGAVAAIPEDNRGTLGKVILFNTTTGAILNTLDVGYHPDNVSFSSDGLKLFVANEGELGTTEDEDNPGNLALQAPGSLSVIDLAGGAGAATASTYDFSAPNLAPGVSIDGIRVHGLDDSLDRVLQIEPEYTSYSNGKVYVSLQENNALGVFDLATEQWSAINDLGTIRQIVDASNRDDAIAVNDILHGMPMPDTIATYSVGGKTYIVTANEGDARGDDGDILRSKDQNLDPTYEASLDATYGGDALDNENLGRIHTLTTEGDKDDDGDIDQLTMLGTRSVTIWDEDGEIVWDSGSFFELWTAFNDPENFNINEEEQEVDARSDDKGPEPEALVLGEAFGKTFGLFGMERTGHLFLFDLSDPESPLFLDAFSGFDIGEYAPEGMAFISAEDSPNGIPAFVVASEVSQSVAIYALIPEPSTVELLAFGGLLGLLVLRRRR